ncbi:MAG TPA: DUF4118 domain-containing protein [Stellaceae bacterium]|nr:DUF4118 domain-containing protein [Stellaceae bacterium]
MPQQLDPAELAFRIAGVCACVALSAFVAHEFLEFHVNVPYLAFLPAVAMCCLFDGLAAGVAATVLGGLDLWYFFLPPDGFGVPNIANALHLFVFLGVAGFMCWVIHVQRRSNEQLMQENFELGYKLGLLRELRAARHPTTR